MRLALLLEKPKLGSAGTFSGSKLAQRTIALLKKKCLLKEVVCYIDSRRKKYFTKACSQN